MIIGNVEFKEVRIFSNGKSDIIMEEVGGSDYYAETFKWRYDGNYITFTKGNTTYQFQITDFIFPELSLRDSRGKYTWAWRRPEDCIK
jgi:NADPH:quinone reductase-like Zn-dependent oxidoreductase